MIDAIFILTDSISNIMWVTVIRDPSFLCAFKVNYSVLLITLIAYV